jgi:hypothetical protein
MNYLVVLRLPFGGHERHGKRLPGFLCGHGCMAAVLGTARSASMNLPRRHASVANPSWQRYRRLGFK